MNKLLKHLRRSALFALVFCTNLALAHNSIKASSPAADAELLQSPVAIELTFSDATYLEALQLFSGDIEINIGFEPPAAQANSFSVALPTLAAGVYTVNWVVVGDDTHEIKGSFSFSVRN